MKNFWSAKAQDLCAFEWFHRFFLNLSDKGSLYRNPLAYLCGFTHTAQALFQKGMTDDQEAIETVIQRIKDDPEWMQAIEKQAKERGITIDESLFQNAEYVVQTEKTKQEQIN